MHVSILICPEPYMQGLVVEHLCYTPKVMILIPVQVKSQIFYVGMFVVQETIV